MEAQDYKPKEKPEDKAQVLSRFKPKTNHDPRKKIQIGDHLHNYTLISNFSQIPTFEN